MTDNRGNNRSRRRTGLALVAVAAAVPFVQQPTASANNVGGYPTYNCLANDKWHSFSLHGSHRPVIANNVPSIVAAYDVFSTLQAEMWAPNWTTVDVKVHDIAFPPEMATYGGYTPGYGPISGTNPVRCGEHVMKFNTGQTLSDATWRSVICHEIGHTVGLNHHQYENQYGHQGFTNSCMTNGSVYPAGLVADEFGHIAAYYP